VVQLLPVPMCPPHAVSRCDVEGKTSAAITQVHTCVRKHEVAEIIDGGDQTLAVSGLPTNRARLVDAALLTCSYDARRRRRITPKPTRAVPKRASDAGSGTGLKKPRISPAGNSVV